MSIMNIINVTKVEKLSIDFIHRTVSSKHHFFFVSLHLNL